MPDLPSFKSWELCKMIRYITECPERVKGEIAIVASTGQTITVGQDWTKEQLEVVLAESLPLLPIEDENFLFKLKAD